MGPGAGHLESQISESSFQDHGQHQSTLSLDLKKTWTPVQRFQNVMKTPTENCGFDLFVQLMSRLYLTTLHPPLPHKLRGRTPELHEAPKLRVWVEPGSQISKARMNGTASEGLDIPERR